MSNIKLNKIEICKNFLGFGMVALIISLVFLFKLDIGFTVFENIRNISLSSIIIVIWLISIVITIIMCLIILIIYKIKKNRIEKEVINDAKK